MSLTKLPLLPSGNIPCWNFVLGQCVFNRGSSGCKFRSGHATKHAIPNQWAQQVADLLAPGLQQILANGPPPPTSKKSKRNEAAGKILPGSGVIRD
mmetsp:Transcript_32316/g.64280  ORF Transcript_32316/g.64280 Transcript_32316/m.64280 type:complete len:96 (-) Transcript_32316:497-784(-)